MKTATLKISSVVPIEVPRATQEGGWLFTVKGVGENSTDLSDFTETEADDSIDFGDLEPGDYIASGARCNALGEALEAPRTATFTVAEDEPTTRTISGAGGLSVTLS